jgi:hypothetical protein
VLNLPIGLSPPHFTVDCKQSSIHGSTTSLPYGRAAERNLVLTCPHPTGDGQNPSRVPQWPKPKTHVRPLPRRKVFGNAVRPYTALADMKISHRLVIRCLLLRPRPTPHCLDETPICEPNCQHCTSSRGEGSHSMYNHC